MDKVYNKYDQNGDYRGTIVPDGTRIFTDGDDFTVITPDGYKFKFYNVNDVVFLGQQTKNELYKLP